MKKIHKKKLAILCLTIGILFTLVSIIGFQNGMYYRTADVGVDVGTNSFHVEVWIQRVGEEPQFVSHHAGVLTTIGKNWIEGIMGDTVGTDVAKYISLSTSTDTPSAAWTQIPTEISTGGLERATGTYASTGDGVWTIEKQWTASASHVDVQLCGFQWATSGDNNLLWADTFTPVTLNSGDKLTVTGTTTIS